MWEAARCSTCGQPLGASPNHASTEHCERAVVDRLEQKWRDAVARCSNGGAWDYSEALLAVFRDIAELGASIADPDIKRAALDRLQQLAAGARVA